MEPTYIPWHTAFVAAIQLELEAYQDSLEFYPEYQLTTEPLLIDCVVIKKSKETVIRKNIATIFREVNLLEFKSPDDYVSVDDFYKVYGYACQYVYLNNVSITSLTISFIESHYPKKLIEHLKNVRGYTVEKTNPGIYTVKGDILPIQVIDSRKLSTYENLWLKGLSNKLKPLAVLRIGDAAMNHGLTALIRAYMNAIAHANFQAVEEAINMSTAAKSLDEVFERTGMAARWEARAEARGVTIGEARGEQRKAIDVAKNMIDLGYPLEAIASVTKLDPEKVKELFQEAEKKD